MVVEWRKIDEFGVYSLTSRNDDVQRARLA